MNEELYDTEDQIVLSKELVDSISKLDLSYNNVGGKQAHLRDTFLSVERQYIMELLQDNEIRNLIREYNCYNSEELFKSAEEIVQKVENNLIPYEDMEKIEKVLTILLTAIKDKVLVKILERYPDYEEENERGYGRSR